MLWILRCKNHLHRNKPRHESIGSSAFSFLIRFQRCILRKCTEKVAERFRLLIRAKFKRFPAVDVYSSSSWHTTSQSSCGARTSTTCCRRRGHCHGFCCSVRLLGGIAFVECFSRSESFFQVTLTASFTGGSINSPVRRAERLCANCSRSGASWRGGRPGQKGPYGRCNCSSARLSR